jgi:hypothetical protein
MQGETFGLGEISIIFAVEKLVPNPHEGKKHF